MLPHFHGTVSRMQCFPHVLNLVVKVNHESHCLQHVLMHVFLAFLTFVFKQYKQQKIVVGAGTKQKHGHSQATAAVPLPEPESLKQEFELEGGEELSSVATVMTDAFRKN